MTVDRTEAALVVSVVALIPAVYASALPPAASVAVQPDDYGHQRQALTTATVTALGLSLGVAAATRSPLVAVCGLLMVTVEHCTYARAVGP